MVAKRKFDEVKEEIELMGFSIDPSDMNETNYKGVNKLQVICKCGEKWSSQLTDLKRGRLCKLCASVRRPQNRQENWYV